MSIVDDYLEETVRVARLLDRGAIERLAGLLESLRRQGGRLFVLGVGGGAAHASHAASDFRKLAGIEAYAPTDNVAELTARTNDAGWDTIFLEWLRTSRLGPRDMLLVFSVGGGDLERNVSPNLVRALQFAREVGARIGGVVGRDGGFTARVADACVVVPTVNPSRVTYHTEGFQAVVWHLLVAMLQTSPPRWESTAL